MADVWVAAYANAGEHMGSTKALVKGGHWSLTLGGTSGSEGLDIGRRPFSFLKMACNNPCKHSSVWHLGDRKQHSNNEG